MFPMTITINNSSELEAILAALRGASVDSPKAPPCVGHAAETAKEAAKSEAKEEPKTEVKKEPKTEVKKEPKTEAKPEAKPTDAPTYQDAANAITKLARTKGRDAAIGVLAKFGATRLPDVQPEQFAAVIAACEEAGA